MKKFAPWFAIVTLSLFLVLSLSLQSANAGTSAKIVVPHSSVPQAGPWAHTHILIIDDGVAHPDGPASSWETPGSISCVYKLVKVTKGCPIATSKTIPLGGVGAIAIVDAYDNPQAAQDLQVFSSQFGLPTATFQTVYASGHQPQNDPGGWSLEEALDIEMAHAMAPKAKLFLVEANSNSFADLYLAEQVAGKLVAQNGGGVVSNSWSGGEYSGQQNDEKKYFTTKGVVYFASTGDSGLNRIGVPSTMASVVAAGGTFISRDSSGKFVSENYWGGGGGGISQIEARPKYQDIIKKIVGAKRGVPDISAVATNVATYDADGGIGWIAVGGTSISSPLLAGIVNAGAKLEKSSFLELSMLYKEYQNPTQYKQWFRDITLGNSNCKVGWDICTGIGAPLTFKGK